MIGATLFEFDTTPFALEKQLWSSGIGLIAGVDEAGRGALAGPVVAAAVIFEKESKELAGRVKDSKKLKPREREELFPLIQEAAKAFGVGVVEPGEIDRVNILNATLQAMRLAVASLSTQPDLCLIDGNVRAPIQIPQRLIIKGDDRVTSIAAASILAKVTRDRLMDEMDSKFPGYSFSLHKGYGTLIHQEAIRSIGLSPIHRKSFSLKSRAT